MARPNGSIARTATTAPPRNPSGDTDQGAPREPQFAQQWPGFPPPPVPAPPQGRGEPPLDPAYHEYYGQDRGAGAPALPQHGFAEQGRDPYGEPSLPAQSPFDFDQRRDGGYAANGGYGHGADPRTDPLGALRTPSVAPQFEPFAPHEQAQQPHGYERFAPPQAGSQASWPPPPADHGHYAPAQPEAYANGQYAEPGYAAPQVHGYDPAPGYQTPDAQQWRQDYDWQQPPGAASGHGHDAHGQQSPHAYLQQEPYGGYAGGYAQPEAAGQAPPYDRPAAEGDYAYDDAEADVPERSGPRPIVIIGALLGAIALGGGMAYGYKTFVGGSSTADGRPPVLRADSTPAKARPADPGGRTIAHTDKKFLNRLAEDRTAPSGTPANPVPVSVLPPTSASSPREVESDDGPRKVTTVVVNRDGSIDTPVEAPPALSNVPSVPGMVIEGLRPVQVAPRSPPPPAAPLRQSEPPQQPVREAALAPPAAQPRAIARPPTAEPTERAPRRPVVREAAPPATTAATGRGGYVAVLASRRSRMDALKAFADMQQKYGSVLQSKTPDVREVNLGAKGVWYRVLVGPPGAKESASGVCGQLKTQGFTGCWISSY